MFYMNFLVWDVQRRDIWQMLMHILLLQRIVADMSPEQTGQTGVAKIHHSSRSIPQAEQPASLQRLALGVFPLCDLSLSHGIFSIPFVQCVVHFRVGTPAPAPTPCSRINGYPAVSGPAFSLATRMPTADPTSGPELCQLR